MDAIKLLIDQHKEVENLFLRYESSDEEEKNLAAKEICKNLEVHMAIEEEIFYPAVYQVFNDKDDKLVDEAIEEHSSAKLLIDKIKPMSAGLMRDAAVKALKLAIEHHVEEEETEMFPKLQRTAPEIVQLGDQLHRRAEQLKSMSA